MAKIAESGIIQQMEALMKIKSILSVLKSRIQERIEIEKRAQQAAKIVRNNTNMNGLTMNLLVMQAQNGAPLAHSCINHLNLELTAMHMSMHYDPNTNTTTLTYTEAK
jgi:hypothetical protein